MKLTGLTVPLLIVSLTAATVCGLGTLAVRASAASTRTSIDLLRMQLQVTRLHEQLLRRSQERFAAEAKAVLPRVPTMAEIQEAPEPAEESLARPWPDGVGIRTSRRTGV